MENINETMINDEVMDGMFDAVSSGSDNASPVGIIAGVALAIGATVAGVMAWRKHKATKAQKIDEDIIEGEVVEVTDK